MKNRVLSVVSLALMLVACDHIGPELSDSREIKVRVSDTYGTHTKAAEKSPAPRIITNRAGDMSVCEYVTDQDMPMTKGTIIGTGNLGTVYGKFHVDGYLDSETEPSHFISDMTVSFKAGSWGWDSASDAPVWRDGVKTIFWSHAPDFQLEIDQSEPLAASFQYEPRIDGKADFSNTADILVAFNEETRHLGDDGTLEKGESNYYDTKFYHALAALKFGLEIDGIADNVEIQDITLSGVHGSGTCDVTGSGTGSGMTAFGWRPAGETVSLKENVTKEQLSEGYCLNGDGVLFLMPQSAENVSITVTFIKYGNEIVKTVDLTAPGGGWLAGKSYTYLLKAIVHVPGEEIDIDYSFSFKGFKNDGGIRRIGPFETVGAKKIGIILAHNYKESSGFGSADFYIESLDGSKNSKSTDVDYDFLPLPASESFPYSGGDGVMEHYTGLSPVTDANKGDLFHVFDVSGYDAFYIVCHSKSSANDGRWSGEFRKMIFLDVEPQS